MKNINRKNARKLIKRAKANPGLEKEFQKDPAAFLKKNNINADDLPPEVMEKISGGIAFTAALGIIAAITGITASAAATANGIDQIVDRHK